MSLILQVGAYWWLRCFLPFHHHNILLLRCTHFVVVMYHFVVEMYCCWDVVQTLCISHLWSWDTILYSNLCIHQLKLRPDGMKVLVARKERLTETRSTGQADNRGAEVNLLRLLQMHMVRLTSLNQQQKEVGTYMEGTAKQIPSKWHVCGIKTKTTVNTSPYLINYTNIIRRSLLTTYLLGRSRGLWRNDRRLTCTLKDFLLLYKNTVDFQNFLLNLQQTVT